MCKTDDGTTAATSETTATQYGIAYATKDFSAGIYMLKNDRDATANDEEAKMIQIGYNIPVEGVNKLRLSLSAQNLLTITKYTGFDPEVSAGGNIINGYGVDYANYPLTRSFLLSLNFSL